MKVVNKKALHDYEVLQSFEAGIVLSGAEVKSAKSGSISFAGSRVLIRAVESGEPEGVFVVGMTISPYKYSGDREYDPTRSRKLLLKRSEIEYLRSKLSTKGLTLVPLSCYTKRDLIKIEVGLVRGKKQYE